MNPKLPFYNRVALVTGAGRGIGKATSLHLAKLGASVICVARTQSEVESRGGPVRSDSFAGLISYTRLLLCRPSDGVAVGHLVRG